MGMAAEKITDREIYEVRPVDMSKVDTKKLREEIRERNKRILAALAK